MKVYVCRCKECKNVKNKRRNRKMKAIIKRLCNKKRRAGKEKYFNWYWA